MNELTYTLVNGIACGMGLGFAGLLLGYLLNQFFHILSA